MRFFSAWVCGVCSAWAYVAWLDGGGGLLVFALVMVLVTFAQAMWRETLTQRVTEKAVQDLYAAIKVEGSEEHQAFIRGLEKAVRDKAGEKL